MQLTLHRNTRSLKVAYWTMHIFIIQQTECVEKSGRIRNEWRTGEASEPDKTKCLAVEEEACRYNGYLYYRRERQSRSQLQRSAVPGQQNFSPIGPPSLSDINIDENDIFIRERQVCPWIKSQEIYWDAALRRQPFLRWLYIKRNLQTNSDRSTV